MGSLQSSDFLFPIFRDCSSERDLKLVSGSLYLPKENELKPKGDDSHFICQKEGVIGVADGVGGWALKGIDAGEYARRLMKNCYVAVKKGEIDLKRVLGEAYAYTKVAGSSTACLLSLSGSKLHAINVGDSGFMVLRRGRVVYQSPLQQHRFNHPYQLGNSNASDTPSCAQELEFQTRAGDIIVMATDGLLDNVFPWEVELAVWYRLWIHEQDGDDLIPEEIAYDLAEIAMYNSLDHFAETPFSIAAQQAGKERRGGKVDDITVIVSFVI
ncbi:PPM-type phosphatase-like domain [Dillenia turbinata]|uniref:Protein phosphatase n=1 Tax=Dillenia turbinata TaxID=194707 RepID=A0AAN8W6T9_9MAGN